MVSASQEYNPYFLNLQTELLEALKEKDIQLQRKVAELSQCKAQSSKEVSSDKRKN